jgi:hypothetical protein
MVLTILSMLALAAAFVYLLWSIGAQHPDRTLRGADRPDREERLLRKGSDMGPEAPRARRRLRSAPPPRPDDPALPTHVTVDRGLAKVLIDEAAAAGANSRQIFRAAKELRRGDRHAAAGRHHEAAERYGRAWATANRALDELR